MAPVCGAMIPRQGAIGKFPKKGCVTIKYLNLNRSERWKEKILERLRSQLVKKSQGARSIQKVKQKRFFLKRNEGISSIVYLLYLKQIYLHIFMQHSFITIYSLDSISCGRGFQCSLITEKANSSYCTDWFWNNSHLKCTVHWFFPDTFVHFLFICHARHVHYPWLRQSPRRSRIHSSW